MMLVVPILCQKKLLSGKCILSRYVAHRFYSETVRKYSETRALEHFDDVYGSIYGNKWKSIRAALLTKHKSVAVVNNFADPGKISEELKLSGAINLKIFLETKNSTVDEIKSHNAENVVIPGMTKWLAWSKSGYHKYLSASNVPINIKPEPDFIYPSSLLIYSYKRCDVTKFQKVKPTENNNRLSHITINGSSIFPPLMLNVQANDKIYDACSSPGGKSLLLLQTLHPITIVCNDIDQSRINKVRTAFKQFLIDYENDWKNKRIFISTEDARDCRDYGLYDKILVDVPCTTDRDAVKKFKKTNLFKTGRSKELSTLPEMQTEILTNCIKLLKPGGQLVYSTCTLSPVQNDGVVHMAIAKAYVEDNITVTVNDLSDTIRPFKELFTFQDSNEMRYGQLVLPHLTNNFGPLYFSKITRH